jgi:hypothetical protein
MASLLYPESLRTVMRGNSLIDPFGYAEDLYRRFAKSPNALTALEATGLPATLAGNVAGNAATQMGAPPSVAAGIDALTQTGILPVAIAKGAPKVGKEIARQYETGEGLIGRMSIDPREYMFAGRNAKTADLVKLDEAEKLRAQGMPDRIIRERTGWSFAWPDNQPRFEISDKSSEFAIPTTRKGYTPSKQFTDDEFEIAKQLEGFDGSLDDYKKYYQAKDKAYKENITQDKYKLSEVYNNPEIQQAYPQLKNIDVDFYKKGSSPLSYAEAAAFPERNKMSFATTSSERSIPAHELQHFIQETEKFAQGGNPVQVRGILQDELSEKVRKNLDSQYAYEALISNASRAENSLYLKKLEKLENADNITPRQITGLGDWYKYSGEIRSSLGSMPKKSGYEQKQWLRNAARIIKENALKDRKSLNLSFSEKELKSIARQKARQASKFSKDAGEAYKARNQLNKIKKLSDDELYNRLAGEAEARLTQYRLDLTPEERLAQYPYDPAYFYKATGVPFNELIVRGLLD